MPNPPGEPNDPWRAGPADQGARETPPPSWSEGGAGTSARDASGAPPPGGTDLPFARLLGCLGLAILALAGLLLALPGALEGSAAVYLIAYVIAALFGPVGFSLLASAWRIRNRAVHGTETPPSHRRWQRILGTVLLGVGLFLVLGAIAGTGTLARIFEGIWGFSLAVYGLRVLIRSLAADGA